MLTLDKPTYLGFSILNLSKLLMYEFYYKYINRKFNVDLLFTDTDSLIYETEADDAYEDFYSDSKFFDFVKKKVIGKMEDEFKGKIIY